MRNGWFGCGFLSVCVSKDFGDGAREIVDAAGKAADAGFLAALGEGRQFLDGILGGLIESDFALQRVPLCGEALALAGRRGGELLIERIEQRLVLVNASLQSSEGLREILLRSGVSGSVC